MSTQDADARVDSWQSEPPAPNKSSSVRPRPASTVAAKLGFDDPAARASWLEEHGVRGAEGDEGDPARDWAGHLLAHVVDPSTEALVAALEGRPERARSQGALALPHRYHVVTFGQGVESAGYFELRLQLGARYFRAGEELGTLLTALGRFERAIVAAVLALSFEEDFTAAELVDHVLAVSALDRTLAAQGYWSSASGQLEALPSPEAMPSQLAANDGAPQTLDAATETTTSEGATTESATELAASVDDEVVEVGDDEAVAVADERIVAAPPKTEPLRSEPPRLRRSTPAEASAENAAEADPAPLDAPVWAKLVRSVREAEQNGLSLSVAVMSLDASGETIARLGREACAGLLASAADRVSRVIVDEDAVGVVGPTELLLVFRGVPVAQAALVCDRLRLRMRRDPLPTNPFPLPGQHRSSRNVTASFGVVQLGVGEGPSLLLERARQALARAHAAGPDRVELDRIRPVTKV